MCDADLGMLQRPLEARVTLTEERTIFEWVDEDIKYSTCFFWVCTTSGPFSAGFWATTATWQLHRTSHSTSIWGERAALSDSIRQGYGELPKIIHQAEWWNLNQCLPVIKTARGRFVDWILLA